MLIPMAFAAPEFGLTVREDRATLNIDFTGSTPNSYSVVNAFPNLIFNQAIYFSGVPTNNPTQDYNVVVAQDGYVYIFENSTTATTHSTFLDINNRVTTNSEMGLLGLAFDPDYINNGYVYVYYTTATPLSDCPSPGQTTCIFSEIVRYTRSSANPLTLDLSSETLIFAVEQPYATHNGGTIAFGPDNMLYLALGDGGDATQQHSQNRTTFLGTMIRIDVSDPSGVYAIPSDNPFVGLGLEEPGRTGAGQPIREEIWAYGFRNPFRFSFDSFSGELWLGDVGEDTIEEIDIVQKGGNYGWHQMEGSQQSPFYTTTPSNHSQPVFEMSHSTDGAVSILGGIVYRGSEHPSLNGTYLFSDTGAGGIYGLTPNHEGNSFTSSLIASYPGWGPLALGTGNQQEVYIVNLGGHIDKLQANSGTGSIAVPALLSQTGLFADLTSMTANAGVIPYDINTALWSDGTEKFRWISLPNNTTIEFHADDPWTFPIGTVLIKHFEIDLDQLNPGALHRLETRLMIRTNLGWEGFTYRWNAAQTDADLLSSAVVEELQINTDSGVISQSYLYPSSGDCLQCHNHSAGYSLGVVAKQLNRDFQYGAATDNQLRAWNNIGLFDFDIGLHTQYGAFSGLDSSVSLTERSRSYLAANCGHCHRPGGVAATPIDLRYEASDTQIIDTNPQRGDLGLVNAKIISSGSKESSVLWERMNRRGHNQMPPLATSVIDATAVQVIGDWIDQLGAPLDSDGDTIPDDIELSFGLDPNDASDAGLDLDGDGLSNAEEYVLGTILNNPDSDGDTIPDGVDPAPLSHPHDEEIPFLPLWGYVLLVAALAGIRKLEKS